VGNLKRAVIATSGGVLALTVAVHTERGANGLFESRERSVPRSDSRPIVPDPAGRASPLRVHRVRLEAAPPPIPKPSVVLKFDVVNDGLVPRSGVILEVTILERPSADADRHVVAGPFTIRGDVNLQAGYTLNYEMLLRNLPSDCDCVADVTIVSDRPAASSGAKTAR
jgi:hypothetical protein